MDKRKEATKQLKSSYLWPVVQVVLLCLALRTTSLSESCETFVIVYLENTQYPPLGLPTGTATLTSDGTTSLSCSGPPPVTYPPVSSSHSEFFDTPAGAAFPVTAANFLGNTRKLLTRCGGVWQVEGQRTFTTPSLLNDGTRINHVVASNGIINESYTEQTTGEGDESGTHYRYETNASYTSTYNIVTGRHTYEYHQERMDISSTGFLFNCGTGTYTGNQSISLVGDFTWPVEVRLSNGDGGDGSGDDAPPTATTTATTATASSTRRSRTDPQPQ